MNRTAEQQAIISCMADTNDNLVIDAKAGSGKTTTILEGLDVLRGDSLLMAFNRAIADELQRKASAKFGIEVMSRIQIGTVHRHGLKAFNRAGLRAKTLDSKVMFMLKDMLEASEYDSKDDIWKNLGKISRLVGAAKSAGFGLSSTFEEFPRIESMDDWYGLAEHYNIEEELSGETDIEEVCSLARRLLKRSNDRTNSIDFDDMIYLPLLLDLQLPLYDNVLIDEAQDINATRRELAFRSVKPGGRLIAVGDPNQAIYGFTGADVASLQNIQRRSKATTLPLTICWRCDAEIIRSAQEQVPAIQARPGAPDGQVLTINFEDDRFLDLPQPGDAILCRLNKPNVAVCLGLLRRGVRAKIEGRDLGKKLEHHVQKACPLYASTPLDEVLLDLDTYRQAEVGKLVAKNKPEVHVALLEDEIEAAQLILERTVESQPSARYPAFAAQINELFGDQVGKGYVTLSSVHKAKGREWPTVYILGYDDWMPHSMAKMPWEKGQEQNLIYVAKTRAERVLVLVNGAKGAIEAGVHRQVSQRPATDAEPTPDEEFDYVSANYKRLADEAEKIPLVMPSLDQLKGYRK